MPSDYSVTYECPIAGVEHRLPGPDVRVMKIGDAGFVVACNCGPEALEDADEQPHPTEDHIVNVYGDDPSPEEWLELEDAADGWYETTRWHPAPEGFDGTLGKRRQEFRDKIREIADDNDENSRGGADETDRAARAVECPMCEAPTGQKCRRPSGHRVRKSHADRKDLAREAGELGAKDAETTCQGELSAWSG